MEKLNGAGLVLVRRAIEADPLNVQGFSQRCGVGQIRLKRLIDRGAAISKEEMGYIAEAIGWPMKYIVIK